MSTTDDLLEPVSAPHAPAAAAPGVVAGIVGAHLEPVTRFDGRDLTALEPERAFDIALDQLLSQEVALGIERHEGPGRLGASVQAASGEDAMQQALGNLLARAHAGAHDALQAWVDADPGAYRRLLPGHVCLPSGNRPFGYEQRCGGCAGHGQVTCLSCNGRGRNDCTACGARGRRACWNCHGSHQVSCSSCGGGGRVSRTVWSSHWDEATRSTVNRSHIEHHSCGGCGGSGHLTCTHCDYAGEILCTACIGQGHLRCTPCAATGLIDCSQCLATGIRHVFGLVAAHVTVTESSRVHSEDGELVQLARQHLTPAATPRYAALANVTHAVSRTGILTVQEFALPVAVAVLQAGAARFRLHAFGPKHEIFDFRNIAGHLLGADLQVFEARVAATRWWRLRSGASLLGGTACFVESELNLLIAEQVSAGGGGAAIHAAVEGQFKGLVNQAYVQRASGALQRALSRIFVAELVESGAYAVALAALAACAMFLASWPWPGPWPAGACALAGFGLGFMVLEWVTRRRIRARFEAEIAARIVNQISASGAARKVRGVALAIATGVVAASLAATQQLPWVRAAQLQRTQAQQARQALSQWFSQSPDLRLRRYPDAAFLRAESDGGDPQAQLVYAWALLLGTPAIPKDVPAATELLEKAALRRADDPLLRTARDVAVLNSDALPAALRTTTADLQAQANAGFVEARYWLARVQVAPNSPTFNLQAGLRALTQAADAGHASAALALGTRYANGDGVRRDPVRARHYLDEAARSGLTPTAP